jgi:hypothetical protein
VNLDCDPVEQQTRHDLLEWLYELDGRHDPTHQSHGLYTGLFQSLRVTPNV